MLLPLIPSAAATSVVDLLRCTRGEVYTRLLTIFANILEVEHPISLKANASIDIRHYAPLEHVVYSH